jgi:hypothetical protein
MDDKLLNRIISTAYGDSGWKERLKVNKIIRTDPEAIKVFESYRSVAHKIHKLPKVTCPPEIIKAGRRRIRLTAAQRFQLLKPVAAFAIILIAAVIAIFSLMDIKKPEYTAAEVRTAEMQAKESLALVNRILNRTASTIGNEILPERINKPVQKGLNIINNLLIGG